MKQLFVSDTAFLLRLQANASQQGTAVFYLQGDQITNKNKLLEEIATVMHFPEYFSENWDALYDCLTDLSWCVAKDYLFVYDNAQVFAHAAPEQWQTFCAILRDAVAFWQETETPLTLVMVGAGCHHLTH